MNIYALIYGYILSVGCISYLISHKKAKNSKLVLVMIFILFFVLSVLRSSNVGTDLYVYLDIFNNVKNTEVDLNLFQSRFEFGYILFNKFIYYFFQNEQFFIAITATIVLIGFYFFINKYSKNKWLSAFLFVGIGIFAFSLSVIRASLAGIIILFSYKYLKERNFLKFSLLVLVACFFHIGAIVFIISYPITYLKIDKTFYKLITIVFIGLFVFLNEVTLFVIQYFPKYSYYISGAYMQGDIRIAAVKSFLIFLIIILLGIITNYHKNSEDGKMWLQILIIGLLFLGLSMKYTLFNREAWYFNIFSLTYLPNAVETIKNKWLKFIILILIIVLFILDSLITLFMRPEWSGISPYHFFWN